MDRQSDITKLSQIDCRLRVIDCPKMILVHAMTPFPLDRYILKLVVSDPLLGFKNSLFLFSVHIKRLYGNKTDC